MEESVSKITICCSTERKLQASCSWKWLVEEDILEMGYSFYEKQYEKFWIWLCLRSAIYHVRVNCIRGHPVCTYALPRNLCLYLGSLCGPMRAVWLSAHTSASQDASNSSLFSGCNPESQLSPHPTLTHKYTNTHRHTLGCGINIPLHAPGSLRPGAADTVSGWDDNTHIDTVVL